MSTALTTGHCKRMCGRDTPACTGLGGVDFFPRSGAGAHSSASSPRAAGTVVPGGTDPPVTPSGSTNTAPGARVREPTGLCASTDAVCSVESTSSGMGAGPAPPNANF